MEKKIKFLLAVFTLLFVFSSLNGQSDANSSKKISVSVNDENIAMSVSPIIVNGRTLVPIREISEALGYTVNWDPVTHTVYLNNQQEVSKAQNPSNEKIIVNGNPVFSDVDPQVYKGRTMVPIRVISKAIGAEVNWNQLERQVTVNVKGSNQIVFPII